MKTLAILFTLFYFLNALAVAPYGFKGQQQAATLYSNVLQFPNNQVTNLGGINALVETGNNNLLVNPSFEHLTFSTSWTNSAGTFTEETVAEIHGKKAAKLVLSSQTMSLTQSSTLYASQFADGVQGLASVRVKSNVALKVCSIQAGTVSTSNCVDVPSDNKWGLFKVPFILGATSNGISIASSGGAVSGTVYIDDAFVGAVDLKVDTDQSRIAGESFFAGTTSCSPSTTATTISPLSASAACPGPTIVNSSLGVWATTDSDLLRQTVTNLPAGRYKATFLFGNFTSSGANTLFAINDGTTTCEPTFGAPFSTGTIGQIVSCTFNYSSSGNRVFELYAASQSAATLTVQNGVSSPRVSTKFILEYFGSGSVYSSNNANYDWTPYTPTLSGNTNFGCNLQHMRNGASMKIKGTCTWTGAGNTSPPRFTLPNSLLTSFDDGTNININKALDSGIQDYGVIAYVSGTSGISLKREYIPLATNGSPVGTDNSFPFTPNTGDTAIVNIEVPISTWNNSNIIIGQFNGLQTCTDTLACTDTFSAAISSTGLVTNENVDWITGNGSVSDTSLYGLTFKTGLFTVNPNCTLTPQSNNAAATLTTYVSSNSPSSLSARTLVNAVKTVFDFYVICQKQGADYIGKTAMAVASDQNLRTSGVTKGVVYSATTTGTTVTATTGSWISSISNPATGNFVISFATNTFAATPICTITGYKTGAETNSYHCNYDLSGTNNASTMSIRCNQIGGAGAYAAFNTTQNIVCHGVSP